MTIFLPIFRLFDIIAIKKLTIQIDQPIFNSFWRIWGYVKPKNALASGAPPQTPLGKLTAALPQTPLLK